VRPCAAVTGATGFVGRHAVAALAGAGWRLRLLVRRDPRLEIGAEPVDLVPGDLTDAGALADLVSGADAVIHLAGAVRGRPGAMMAVNRDGTAALAAAVAAAAPAARVVHLSSLAARAPQVSAYAASKAAGEAALAGLDDVRILRPGAIYGPGDRASLTLFRAARWPVQPLLGPPGGRVALIHVRDVATAIVAAAEGTVPPGIHALGDDRREGHDWAGIVAAACAAVGGRFRPVRVPGAALALLGRLGDLAAYFPGAAPMLSSGKTREIRHGDWSLIPEPAPPGALAFPRIALAEGFADTVAWYRAAGWLPAPLPRA